MSRLTLWTCVSCFASVGCSEDAEEAPTSPVCSTSSVQGGGWRICNDELFHRPVAGVCPGELMERDTDNDGLEGLTPGTCTQDRHCTALPNGYCEGARCVYRCLRDSDCAQDQICFCPDLTCIAAECTVDADCPGSSGCVATQQQAAGGRYVAVCQQAGDQCDVDSDCTPPQACLIGSTGRVCGIAPSQ